MRRWKIPRLLIPSLLVFLAFSLFPGCLLKSPNPAPPGSQSQSPSSSGGSGTFTAHPDSGGVGSAEPINGEIRKMLAYNFNRTGPAVLADGRTYGAVLVEVDSTDPTVAPTYYLFDNEADATSAPVSKALVETDSPFIMTVPGNGGAATNVKLFDVNDLHSGIAIPTILSNKDNGLGSAYFQKTGMIRIPGGTAQGAGIIYDPNPNSQMRYQEVQYDVGPPGQPPIILTPTMAALDISMTSFVAQVMGTGHFTYFPGSSTPDGKAQWSFPVSGPNGTSYQTLEAPERVENN